MILTAVLLVGMATSGFAAVQNVKVGGDITIRGIYRSDFDFTKDNTAWPVNKDTCGWLMTTTRIYITSELTDGVAAVIRFINERDWNVEGVTTTNIDLDLAYIKLSDMLVPGLTATLGRQEILLGEGFIVGNRNAASRAGNPTTLVFADPPVIPLGNIMAGDYTARKSFDAIRLDYEVATVPLTLTGFVAKIAETYALALAAPVDVGVDIDLYGINANYQLATAEIEGYFVDLKDSHATKNAAPAPGAASRNFDYQTWGARLAHNVAAVPGFSYRGEIAFQQGVNNVGGVSGIDEKNEALAGYIGGAYAFQDISWEPKIGMTYNYFSGDDKTGAPGLAWDDKNNTWTPIFPDGSADRIGAIGYAVFGAAPGIGNPGGLQVIKVNGSIQPTEKLNLSLAWFNSNLATKVSGVAPMDKKDLGNEIDLGITYTYSEDVTMGLLLGYYVRGDFLKNLVEVASGPGTSTDAMEVVGSVAVSF